MNLSLAIIMNFIILLLINAILKTNYILMILFLICIVLINVFLKKYDNLKYYILSVIFIIPILIEYDGQKYLSTLPKIYFLYAIASIIILDCFLNKQFTKIKVGKLLTIYLLIIVVSSFCSVNFYQSIVGSTGRNEGLATLISYILLFIISSNYFKIDKKLQATLLVSSIIVSLYAIIQFYGLDPLYKHRISNLGYLSFSSLGNPNFLGSYVTLIIPIAIIFFLNFKNKKEKVVYFLWSGIIFFTLLISNTRSAYLAFGIVSIMIFFYYFRLRDRKRIKRLFIIYGLFLIIFISLNYSTDNKLLNRFISIGTNAKTTITDTESADSSGSNRIFIWKRAIKLIPIHPILGCGPDCFSIVFMDKYKNDVDTLWQKNLVVDKAHNEYLQIAVTTGIPSLIIYLLFVGFIIRDSYRKIKNGFTKILPVYMSVIGYLIQAFFNISVISVAPLFWIFLGLLSHYNYYNKINENYM